MQKKSELIKIVLNLMIGGVFPNKSSIKPTKIMASEGIKIYGFSKKDRGEIKYIAV